MICFAAGTFSSRRSTFAAAANGRGLAVVDAARYLFALEGKAQLNAPPATEEDD